MQGLLSSEEVNLKSASSSRGTYCAYSHPQWYSLDGLCDLSIWHWLLVGVTFSLFYMSPLRHVSEMPSHGPISYTFHIQCSADIKYHLNVSIERDPEFLGGNNNFRDSFSAGYFIVF